MVDPSHPKNDTESHPDGRKDNVEPLPVDRLTWAVLLGRWVDFARSALALPDDAQGRRLRNAVPDMIALQAVWFALQHLDELDHAERSLGLDRAELLIDRHAAALQSQWKEEPLPDLLKELIQDAQQALQDAQAIP